MPGMFAGTWYNQHRSEMTLEIDASTGKVAGTFKTGVGSPRPSESFPLVGFVAEDVIAFSVNFGAYRSLTAWAGQLTEDPDGAERIETLWHLARNVADADEPQQLWGAVWAGSDVFRRTPHSAPGGRQVRPSHPLAAEP